MIIILSCYCILVSLDNFKLMIEQFKIRFIMIYESDKSFRSGGGGGWWWYRDCSGDSNLNGHYFRYYEEFKVGIYDFVIAQWVWCQSSDRKVWGSII